MCLAVFFCGIIWFDFPGWLYMTSANNKSWANRHDKGFSLNTSKPEMHEHGVYDL